MSVVGFESATTLDQALEALAAGARPVAGGTDLVVAARQGRAPLPERIVAINRLSELAGIRVERESLTLGALTTHADIAANPVIRESLAALADASAIVGSRATRAHGTIGGNLINASPAMDTGGPILCFDGVVTLCSVRGTRELSIADLWTGPGHCLARSDELLTAIELIIPPPGTGSCYARLEYRRQMEIAVVGACAVVALRDGLIRDARVAITALAPTIRRVREAEDALIGSEGGWNAAVAAGEAAASAAVPIADIRASSQYRRAMAGVITRRAVEFALARARGDVIPIPASLVLHGGAH